MKPWGLVAASAAGRGLLARLPGLADRLGPVASSSPALATRIVKGLKAGTAARAIEELAECDLILLSIRGRASILDLLLQTEFAWKNKKLLICDSNLYSSALQEFRSRGASVASLNPVNGHPACFIVEGDTPPLREARRLVRQLHAKAIEIPAGRMLLYDCGLTLASSLFTPLIETCVSCFRQAGLSAPVATGLASSILQASLRAYLHSGRRSWVGPVPAADRDALDRQQESLSAVNPLMAAYFFQSGEFALDLYQTFPELTRYQKNRFHKKP